MMDAIETLKELKIGRISLTVTMVADYSPDLSWIGEYSNEAGPNAIETGRTDPRYFKYFNPANAEYAQQEFEHMEKYERNEWMMTGICATIWLDGKVIGDDSLWGIEYAYTIEDYHRETMYDVTNCALIQARTFLKSIGKSEREQRFEMALRKIATAPKTSWNKVATAYQNIAIEALDGKPVEQPETIVIFRKFRDGGDIVALFPEMEEGINLCNSYQHIGQHSAASYAWLVGGPNRITVPAKPPEYADLLEELTSIGYTNLKIMKKWMRGRTQ